MKIRWEFQQKWEWRCRDFWTLARWFSEQFFKCKSTFRLVTKYYNEYKMIHTSLELWA